MRVLLQFPEGLKQHALRYAKELEDRGNDVVISASPAYGACDLAIDEARKIGADKLVHFGHNEFLHAPPDFPVEYVPYEMTAELSILSECLKELEGYRRIGLVTTVQHMHQLDEVRAFYERNGKDVRIGRPYGFAKRSGQILGCDVGSASSIDKDVECFVYFGGGLFHPLGAVYGTTKPFLSIDPFIGRWLWLDDYRKKKERMTRAKITRGIVARSFGILVSTKIGQYNMNLAQILKSTLEKNGKTAAILVSNTFDFESLENMREFDAFVNTACPRIGSDDVDRLSKPLLSANELIEVIGIIKAGL